VQVFARGGGYLAQFSGAAIAPVGFDPMGIGVDTANNVYVAETDNDRLEVFGTIS
jgi:DNA-binding beta-propeller fold protein YncE